MQTISKYQNLTHVIHVSIGFTFLFTAYYACQNISSEILKDMGYDNIGFLSVAIIYLVFAVSIVIAVPIKKVVGTKMSLFLGAMMYVVYIGSTLLPVLKYERILEKKDTSS